MLNTQFWGRLSLNIFLEFSHFSCSHWLLSSVSVKEWKSCLTSLNFVLNWSGQVCLNTQQRHKRWEMLPPKTPPSYLCSSYAGWPSPNCRKPGDWAQTQRYGIFTLKNTQWITGLESNFCRTGQLHVKSSILSTDLKEKMSWLHWKDFRTIGSIFFKCLTLTFEIESSFFCTLSLWFMIPFHSCGSLK